MPPMLVTRKRTEDPACQECSDKGFGHDDPPQQKRAAEAEKDHACDEAAPVISEPLADQKNQGNRRDNC